MLPAVIISDIHIGSKYCRRDLFSHFLAHLPAEYSLILNGDVIDDPTQPLSPEDQEILNLIVRESEKRNVIWILGNHDDTLKWPESGQIQIMRHYAIDKRLYVAHGHNFDNVMPHNRWFIILFKWLHTLRIKLGAKPAHVAHYAKKWPLLYRFLCRNVIRNAVEHAHENAYESVACGHVHFPENTTVDGVHYLNTGAWTEEPTYCILVTADTVELLETVELLRRLGSP